MTKKFYSKIGRKTIMNGYYSHEKLMNTKFINSELMNTQFGESRLMNTCFVGAKLINTDLRGTTWSNVDIDKESLLNLLTEIADGDGRATRAKICIDLLIKG